MTAAWAEPLVLEQGELPHSGTAHRFEGYMHGDPDVSFFLIDAPPGGVRGCTPIPTRRSS